VICLSLLIGEGKNVEIRITPQQQCARIQGRIGKLTHVSRMAGSRKATMNVSGTSLEKGGGFDTNRNFPT